MYSLQDTREAQQTWEYKFHHAGREGITLRYGTPGTFVNIMNSIIRKIVAVTAFVGNLRDGFRAIAYENLGVGQECWSPNQL